MNELIVTVLNGLSSASLQAGLIVSLLLGFKFLFGFSLKPGSSYYLWLLVFARLIFPAVFSVELPTYVYQFNPTFERSIDFGRTQDNHNVVNIETLPTDVNVDQLSNSVAIQNTARSKSETTFWRINISDINRGLFLIWCLGVLTALVKLCKNQMSTWRSVTQLPICSDEHITGALRLAQQRLAYNRMIVVKWGCHTSPVSYGYLKPVVLLPASASQLTKSQLSMVFMHELIHHKRFDMVLNLVISLIKCLYWFHPLVWLAHRHMRSDCELSCDYIATQSYDSAGLRDYASLLLKFSIGQDRNKPAMAGVSMSGNIRQIKHRLSALGKWPEKASNAIAKTCLVSLTIVMMGFTAPIIAMTKAHWVDFDSSIGVGLGQHQQKNISGLVTRLDGEGKFPAIVLVAGCGGLQQHHDEWASYLAKSGYVTLRLGQEENTIGFCHKSVAKINTLVTAQIMDAYSSLEYLSQQKFVDADNISIMSWQSWVAIGAAAKFGVGQVYARKFRSAIALYPDCSASYNGDFSIPLQILVGEQDEWAHAPDCIRIQQRSKLIDQSFVDLRVFANTLHGFDNRSYLEEKLLPEAKNLAHLPGSGALAKYMPSVHQEAKKSITGFLSLHKS